MQIGWREANQKFSKAIKAVKAGEEVILTQRGQPIAVTKPLTPSETGGATIHRLEAAGFLRAATTHRPMAPFKARPLKGVPLSKTLHEERDAS